MAANNYHLAAGDRDLERIINCFERASTKKDMEISFLLAYSRKEISMDELIGYCVLAQKE